MRVSAILVFAAYAVCTMPAAAESVLDMLDSPASYQADFYVSGDKGAYSGRVVHAKGREMREFAVKDGRRIVILRRDLDAAYLLNPGGRWYVGLGLSAVGALAGGLDSLQVRRSRIGEDVVDGMRTVKYGIQAKGPKGESFDGHAWFAADEVAVKAAGRLTDAKGKISQVETGLRNLRRTPVSDQDFALPKGWLSMDLRSLPADKIVQAVESLRPLLERGSYQ